MIRASGERVFRKAALTSDTQRRAGKAKLLPLIGTDERRSESKNGKIRVKPAARKQKLARQPRELQSQTTSMRLALTPPQFDSAGVVHRTGQHEWQRHAPRHSENQDNSQPPADDSCQRSGVRQATANLPRLWAPDTGRGSRSQPFSTQAPYSSNEEGTSPIRICSLPCSSVIEKASWIGSLGLFVLVACRNLAFSPYCVSRCCCCCTGMIATSASVEAINNLGAIPCWLNAKFWCILNRVARSSKPSSSFQFSPSHTSVTVPAPFGISVRIE